MTKVALVRWSTARFYRWTGLCSLPVYVPFALFAPPDLSVLPGAIGLSVLMALTFWVTTEATRRGPLSLVAPLTATSPALTASLAVAFLGERPEGFAVVGIACAVVAAILLAYRPTGISGVEGWLGLALASLVLQGAGAFFAKIVVTGSGPTTLLLTSVLVQVAVGAFIARSEPLDVGGSLRGHGVIYTAVLVGAALATVGYLAALSVGPASVIVPFVATSPSLGGLAGVLFLRERPARRQLAGIVVGLVGIVLLARNA